MSHAGWHFKRRERSDEVADPIQGEFFDETSDPEDRRRGPAASLVREAIQNSLDAKTGDEAVHVRFYLSDGEDLAAVRARNWLGDLWPHLRARRSGLRDVPEAPSPCRFVVVEDFGTSGLEGNPRRGTTPDEGERDDFFAFFRANGLSGKAGQEGGRWGVGMSDFNRASRFNTFLALSVRSSDRVPQLIGRCFLLTHKINETEYHPYGRYGRVENTDRDFVLPVENTEVINAFRQDFRLARQPDAPGLSVEVPYADPEITTDAIRSAVVGEYFWPILTGRLTVEISASRRDTERLDPETLLRCAEKDEDPTGLNSAQRSLIQFALDAQTAPESAILTLLPPGVPPRWEESLFPDGRLQEFGRRYQLGELLVFRVPLKVPERQGAAQDSSFLVYVRLDRDGHGYRPVFVRSGLIVPKARERRIRGHSVHALVVIDDEALSSMLGDAETPAHTHWSPDSRNFRDKYEHGQAVLDFVKSAPVQIVEMLSRARGERDWLTLADFFPAPAEDEGLPEEDGGSSVGTGRELPPQHVPTAKPAPYRIVQTAGGFCVVRDSPADTTLPAALRIAVAYDTSRGSPLKRYDPADFDLSRPPVRVGVRAAQIAACGGNELLVRLEGEDFHIEVCGFDENRDLYVKVEAVEDAEADGDGNGTVLPEEAEAKT